LINVISHKAMLAAYGEKSERVTRSHMARAIADTKESRSIGRILARQNIWLWPGAALLAAALALILPGMLGMSVLGISL